MNVVDVELYETQLDLLDRAIQEGGRDESREEAVRRLALDHVVDRLGGASSYVGGRAKDDILESESPSYGDERTSVTLPPVTGKALPVYRGEVLRIEQLAGGQCVDFNAFNLHDYKEFLDCGFTRSFQSFDPRQGEFIWTNAPRGRPMFAILHIADTCELDIVGHRCNRIFEELGWDMPVHPNCQDTLAESIREYGLTPDDVHESFNLWMSTDIGPDGRRQFKWNPARKGDRIDLLALFDLLAVAATCGIGDLVGINNYTFTPVAMQVFEATATTRGLVEAIEERWGRLPSQQRREDFAVRDIQASPELIADPDYTPSFLPLPGLETVTVSLTESDKVVVDGLLKTGVYGTTPGEALRAAFMRWCNTNLTLVRRPKLLFT